MMKIKNFLLKKNVKKINYGANIFLSALMFVAGIVCLVKFFREPIDIIVCIIDCLIFGLVMFTNIIYFLIEIDNKTRSEGGKTNVD